MHQAQQPSPADGCAGRQLLLTVVSLGSCRECAAPLGSRSAWSTLPEACCSCWSSCPAAGSSAQGVTLGTCRASSGCWRAAHVGSRCASLEHSKS